jgi:hypothetical protein
MSGTTLGPATNQPLLLDLLSMPTTIVVLHARGSSKLTLQLKKFARVERIWIISVALHHS